MVTLEKATDSEVKINPGAGMNSGSGPVHFIGDMPTAKLRRKVSARDITGGIIRVGGADIKGKAVRFLIIDGAEGDAWIMADGTHVPTGEARNVAEWLRFVLDVGIYAGIVRLR